MSKLDNLLCGHNGRDVCKGIESTQVGQAPSGQDRTVRKRY
jgi:hypothetical protein